MASNLILHLFILGQLFLLSSSPPLSSDTNEIPLCTNSLNVPPCLVSERTPTVTIHQDHSVYSLQILLPTDWAEDLRLKDIALKSKELFIFTGMTFTSQYLSEKDSQRWKVIYQFSPQNSDTTCLNITVSVKNVELLDGFWSYWEFRANSSLYQTKEVFLFNVQKPTNVTAKPEILQTTESKSPSDGSKYDSTTAPERLYPTPSSDVLDDNDSQKIALREIGTEIHQIKILVIIILCAICIAFLRQLFYDKLKQWFQSKKILNRSHSDMKRTIRRKRERQTSQCESPIEDEEEDRTNDQGTNSNKEITEIEPGPTVPDVTKGMAQQDQQIPKVQYPPQSPLHEEDYDQMAQTMQKVSSPETVNAEEDGCRQLELGVLETNERDPREMEQSPLLKKKAPYT